MVVVFPVTERINPTQFRLNISLGAGFAHSYVRGTGAAFVGITTDIFPDSTRKIFNVIVHFTNSVAAQVGASTIPHNYVGGGTLQGWYQHRHLPW